VRALLTLMDSGAATQFMKLTPCFLNGSQAFCVSSCRTGQCASYLIKRTYEHNRPTRCKYV